MSIDDPGRAPRRVARSLSEILRLLTKAERCMGNFRDGVPYNPRHGIEDWDDRAGVYREMVGATLGFERLEVACLGEIGTGVDRESIEALIRHLCRAAKMSVPEVVALTVDEAMDLYASFLPAPPARRAGQALSAERQPAAPPLPPSARPYHYLKRLDGSVALIDCRTLDPRKTWLGVPVRAKMLWPNRSEWTGTFGVNLHHYRGIWICSCWVEGRPGYHRHPLHTDWPEQFTFWEVDEARARRWFDENHQPLPVELNNQPAAPPPSGGSDVRTEAAASPPADEPSGTADPAPTPEGERAVGPPATGSDAPKPERSPKVRRTKKPPRPATLKELAAAIRRDHPRQKRVPRFLDLIADNDDVTFEEIADKAHQAIVEDEAVEKTIGKARKAIIDAGLPFALAVSDRRVSKKSIPRNVG